jgi:hypothetical protein
MTTTKSDIRAIALDILLDTTNPPKQKVNLDLAIASELARKAGRPKQGDALSGNEWLMFDEVFWDLIMDRIITPGMDMANSGLPWFRLHSEARQNAKRAEQVQKQSGH